MKFLLGYLKEFKKESILAPLFKMLEAIFELLVPLVMASVIDVGIARQDPAYIMKMCVVLVLLGVTGLAFSIFCREGGYLHRGRHAAGSVCEDHAPLLCGP